MNKFQLIQKNTSRFRKIDMKMKRNGRATKFLFEL